MKPVKKIHIFVPNGYSVYPHGNVPHLMPNADLLPHSFLECPCEPFEEKGEEGVTVHIHRPFDLRDLVAKVNQVQFDEAIEIRRTYEDLTQELLEEGIIDQWGFRDMMMKYDLAMNQKHNVQ